MSEINSALNKGYLLENFRLFHLSDRSTGLVEPHYHEFDKVVVFYSGTADYIIEGITYRLQPGDVLFVRHHDIHRPVISTDSVYERAVFWIKPGFLEENSTETERLESCFDLASENRACLYSPAADRKARIKRLIAELENAMGDEAFGSAILARSHFLQLMVEFNRCVMSESPRQPQNIDPKMDEIIRYINGNLDRELSVEVLSSMCYLSRYYFMRRFKEATGYTVHNYIQQKRLTAAAELLDSGMTITEAAAQVGFAEYSSFLRAFKKAFKMTPSEYMQKRERGLDSFYRE
ncbi:MAG: helix-turn-helix domain-containing protein [Oscillospiraceae bacterium]